MQHAKSSRNAYIIELLQAGESYGSVAKKMGVSRSRIFQIVHAWIKKTEKADNRPQSRDSKI